MTDETMVYRPEVGKWTLSRPPTRSEAVMLAAECAAASTDNTISPDAARARAASAQAWAAVAGVAAGKPSASERVTIAGSELWVDLNTGETYFVEENQIPPDSWRRIYVERAS